MIGPFAHDEPPLAIQGTAVALAGTFPHHTHLAAGIPAKQPAAGYIDTRDGAHGMQQWSVGCAPSPW